MPLKLIVEFVAVMLALPLDCIRSPVWLLPVGLLLLRLVTPSAVIVMGALVAVGPVVLAALTALIPGEPAGMVTLTPDSSVTLMGVLLVLTLMPAGIGIADRRAGSGARATSGPHSPPAPVPICPAIRTPAQRPREAKIFDVSRDAGPHVPFGSPRSARHRLQS